MDYNLFPDDYEYIAFNEAMGSERQIKDEEYRKMSKYYKIGSDGKEVGVGILIGVPCGFIIGCIMAITKSSLKTGCTYWAVIVILCILVALVIGKLRDKIFVKLANNAHSECEAGLAAVREEEKRKNKKYREEFENEAEKLAMKYLENSSTIKIVNMMWSKLFYKIINADRRSFDKKVNVSFEYRVFKNSVDIEWKYNESSKFNFTSNNCENLKDPLEQTALSWAIAIGLKNEIMQKFSIDPSGTKSNVDIRRSSYNEAARIEITYTAPNGYYQEPKPW